MEPAAWWQRALAEAVDLIVLSFVLGAGLILVAAVVGNSRSHVVSLFAFLALVSLLFVLPAATVARRGAGHGQTWGKQAVGIRAVCCDGRAFTWPRALVRESLCKGLFIIFTIILLLIPLLIDLAVARRNPQRQMLHDRLAKTRVVKAADSTRPFGGFFNW
jgi:uncharacterized RDD family membrane protein YckC